MCQRSPTRLASSGEGHFHLSTQVFLQTSGSAHFRFPDGQLLLQAGQALVVPTRLLHLETVGSSDLGAPFRNVMISAEQGSLSCHPGHDAGSGIAAALHQEGRAHPQAMRVQADSAT